MALVKVAKLTMRALLKSSVFHTEAVSLKNTSLFCVWYRLHLTYIRMVVRRLVIAIRYS